MAEGRGVRFEKGAAFPSPLVARGKELVEQHGGLSAAFKATHPDQRARTGSYADFDAVRAYQKSQED